MGKVSIGNRVRVDFAGSYSNAAGPVAMRKALDGAAGRVERVNPVTGLALVRLDVRPAPWPGNPTPSTGWWLGSCNLALVDA